MSYRRGFPLVVPPGVDLSMAMAHSIFCFLQYVGSICGYESMAKLVERFECGFYGVAEVSTSPGS